jgi:hypothetical protein
MFGGKNPPHFQGGFLPKEVPGRKFNFFNATLQISFADHHSQEKLPPTVPVKSEKPNVR